MSLISPSDFFYHDEMTPPILRCCILSFLLLCAPGLDGFVFLDQRKPTKRWPSSKFTPPSTRVATPLPPVRLVAPLSQRLILEDDLESAEEELQHRLRRNDTECVQLRGYCVAKRGFGNSFCFVDITDGRGNIVQAMFKRQNYTSKTTATATRR